MHNQATGCHQLQSKRRQIINQATQCGLEVQENPGTASILYFKSVPSLNTGPHGPKIRLAHQNFPRYSQLANPGLEKSVGWPSTRASYRSPNISLTSPTHNVSQNTPPAVQSLFQLRCLLRSSSFVEVRDWWQPACVFASGYLRSGSAVLEYWAARGPEISSQIQLNYSN